MCGICGIIDLNRKKRIKNSIIKKMTSKLIHRGPDAVGHYFDGNIAFGFTRLSIIDLEGGMQPIFNEDDSIVLVCNGEIFNYIELKQELMAQGHSFKTKTDVETIIHLYEEKGMDFLNLINGQFAFVIYDFKKRCLLCARDHFGIIPFFYTFTDNYFIFASEIKSIFEHPGVNKEVDLVGLDQIFSFPGLICPRTMFKGIESLENGHYLYLKDRDDIKNTEYWDMIFPEMNERIDHKDETYYLNHLDELITQSVRLRLRSDVPVGIYVSGGLDSSIIAAKTLQLFPHIKRYTFSIDFEEKDKSESRYQRIIADFLGSHHIEKLFFYPDISTRLEKVIYHTECPIKETYDTASLALSEAARENNIKVVLTGEGADEWFAGYPGYKFDKFREVSAQIIPPENHFRNEINKKIWGDEDFNFEINQYEFKKIKKDLYSDNLNSIYEEFNCLNHKIVNINRLMNRHKIHKRSYLDYKLRLVGHLISDHGDRMAYANSVEARYPFLDKDLVEFAAQIPPHLKLKKFEEKYILKELAKSQIPESIIKREKFAFHAPGSPYLLKKNIEYINDMLSYEKIKREGFFNPGTIEKLKKQYVQEDFKLIIPYDSDLLITVLTFGIFLETFNLR
jgi:asparagine synthase (glutamine-hydrolysing)